MWWLIPSGALLIRALYSRKHKREAESGAMPVIDVVGSRIPQVALKRAPRESAAHPGRVSYVDDKYQFVEIFGPMIFALEKYYGFAHGIILAHAANESGWARLTIGKNLFNIKVGDKVTNSYWHGASIKKSHGRYREYDSFTDSVLDYIRLVGSASRYKRAWANRDNYKKFFEELYLGGYFAGAANVAAFNSVYRTIVGMIG